MRWPVGFSALLAMAVAGAGLAADAPCARDDDAVRMHTEAGDAPAVYLSVGDVPVSQPFDMAVRVCDAQPGARLKVDAIMPAHRHGMNYDPIVDPNGAGGFVLYGMVFHMPGEWQVQVTVTNAGRSDLYVLDLVAE